MLEHFKLINYRVRLISTAYGASKTTPKCLAFLLLYIDFDLFFLINYNYFIFPYFYLMARMKTIKKREMERYCRKLVFIFILMTVLYDSTTATRATQKTKDMYVHLSN